MVDKFFNKKLLMSEASAPKKMVVFKISARPTGATVKINGVTTTSVEVEEGSTVTWEVSLSGYYTQTGTEVMGSSDVTRGVTLTNRTKTISVSSAVQNDYGVYEYVPSNVITFQYAFKKGKKYKIQYTSACQVMVGFTVCTTNSSKNPATTTQLGTNYIDLLDTDEVTSGTYLLPAGTYSTIFTASKDAAYIVFYSSPHADYRTALSGSIKITDNS